MLLVCTKCNVTMKPKENGQIALEMADFGPYKIWQCDKYYCPECEAEVLTGFGRDPISEHYQESFKKWMQKVDVKFRG